MGDIEQPAPGYSYTVERGDTPESIATQAYYASFKDAWEAIYSANRNIIGDDPHRIVAGQVLHIPVSPNPTLVTPKLVTAELNPTPGKNYKVQRNDTVQSIAKKAYKDGGSEQAWRVIYDANKRVIGDNPNWIVAGQILSIPVSIK